MLGRHVPYLHFWSEPPHAHNQRQSYMPTLTCWAWLCMLEGIGGLPGWMDPVAAIMSYSALLLAACAYTCAGVRASVCV